MLPRPSFPWALGLQDAGSCALQATLYFPSSLSSANLNFLISRKEFQYIYYNANKQGLCLHIEKCSVPSADFHGESAWCHTTRQPWWPLLCPRPLKFQTLSYIRLITCSFLCRLCGFVSKLLISLITENSTHMPPALRNLLIILFQKTIWISNCGPQISTCYCAYLFKMQTARPHTPISNWISLE